MPGPIAPLWLVAPLAGIALLVTAGYLMALREAAARPTPEPMPPLRVRLRTATAWCGMLLIPLLAYGFGIATTDDAKTFLLVWAVSVGLLLLILMLASIDLWALAIERRRLLKAHRDEVRRTRAELARQLRLEQQHLARPPSEPTDVG